MGKVVISTFGPCPDHRDYLGEQDAGHNSIAQDNSIINNNNDDDDDDNDNESSTGGRGPRSRSWSELSVKEAFKRNSRSSTKTREGAQRTTSGIVSRVWWSLESWR